MQINRIGSFGRKLLGSWIALAFFAPADPKIHFVESRQALRFCFMAGYEDEYEGDHFRNETEQKSNCLE